jgi:hypothetical protein
MCASIVSTEPDAVDLEWKVLTGFVLLQAPRWCLDSVRCVVQKSMSHGDRSVDRGNIFMQDCVI